MTNLPGNPYQSVGQETLALAYEQRTANLIALAAHMDRSDQITDSYWAEIAERLGLGETDDQ